MNDARIISAVLGAIGPTPWVAVPLAGGMSATAGLNAPSARLVGDKVELCGGITGTLTTGVTLGTLVAAYRPAVNVNLSVVAIATGNVAVGLLAVTTAGVITLSVAATASAVRLDGLFYRLV